MNKTVRRLVIILVLVIWFILIMLPSLAVILASRQEIHIGAGNLDLRIFLLQEANVEGLGLEFNRPFPSDGNCQQTSVNYFMWAGESDNVSYCQCQDPQTGDAQPAEIGSCLTPN